METRNGVKTSTHDATVIGASAVIAAVLLIVSEAVFNWIGIVTGWIS